MANEKKERVLTEKELARQNRIDQITEELEKQGYVRNLVVVHEGIHGLIWGLCAPDKFKTIEFGFMREQLTPYCTCKEPLKKMQYILGAFMPCLVLGIIPCIAAVYVNSVYLLFLGIIMILGAGGDLTIILKMLLYKSSSSDVIIMDHPTECGFIIFER